MVRVSQQKLDDWSRQAIGEYLEGDTKLDDLVTKIARANDLSVDQIKLLAQNTNVKLRVQRPNLKFAAVDSAAVIDALQLRDPRSATEVKVASIDPERELSGTRETMLDKYLADRGAMVKKARCERVLHPSNMLLLSDVCQEKIASARRVRTNIVNQLRGVTSDFVQLLEKEARANGSIDRSYTSVMSVRGQKIVDDLFKAAHESLENLHCADYAPPRFVKYAGVMDPRHPLLKTVDQYIKLAYQLRDVDKEINALERERVEIAALVKRAYGKEL
jgi:hypothetical protein